MPKDMKKRNVKKKETEPVKEKEQDFFISIEEAFPKKKLYYIWRKSVGWVYIHRVSVMIGIAILFIILIIFGAKIYLLFNFLIGKDIYISLTAQRTSFSATQSDIIPISFTSAVSTNFFCQANCHANLVDISTGRSLFQENFMLKTLAPIERNFNISIPGSGTGLLLYNYEISCYSERGILCQTDEKNVGKSMLVDIFYNRSSENSSKITSELEELKTASTAINTGIFVSKNISELLLKFGQYFSDSKLNERADGISLAYYNINKSFNNNFEFWKNEDITEFEKNWEETTNSINEMNAQYNDLLSDFNSTIIKAKINYFNFIGSWRILQKLQQKLITDKVLAVGIDSANDDFQTLFDFMQSQPYSKDTQLLSEELYNRAITLQEIYKNITYSSESFLALSLMIKKDVLCRIGEGSECAVDEVGLDQLAELETIKENFSLDDQDRYKMLCDSRMKLINSTNATIAVLQKIIDNEDILNSNNSNNTNISHTEFMNSTEVYYALKFEQATKLAKFVESSSTQNMNDHDKMIFTLEVQSIIDSAYNQKIYSDSEINGFDNKTKLEILSALVNDISFEYCDRILLKDANISMPENLIPIEDIYGQSILPLFENSIIINNITNDTTSNTTNNITNIFTFDNIKLNISLKLPQCCINNSCNSCCLAPDCRNSDVNYPVLLLHGHAFDKSTSAERNMFIMSALKSKLSGLGYIDAGYLNSYQDAVSNIYMENTSMVTIGSYYFDSLSEDGKYSFLQRKNDNLDDYSLRLRDMISLLKQKSGRDKVIIVAHSMGGLVVRRYMQLFGSDDIYKAVYIFSPNHGINGTTAEFCPLTGEIRECTDIETDSILLRKLSQETSQPVKTYNFIGKGCDTDGSDGDGVVTVGSAYLPGAENIYLNGSCGKLTYFHNEILENDKYGNYLDMIVKAINVDMK